MLIRVLERSLEREIVGSCDTLLDVGCGSSSPIRGFSGRLERTVGVDAFESAINRSKEAGIHSQCFELDALAIAAHFGPNSFDCVLAADLIEHLSKQDGYRLIDAMEAVASKKVIVFTPNGFVPQEVYDGNDLQVHRSGWEVAEMREMGFRVDGVAGWKWLRGEQGEIVRRPRPLWLAVSAASQLLAYRRPEWAFQILCVKNLA